MAEDRSDECHVEQIGIRTKGVGREDYNILLGDTEVFWGAQCCNQIGMRRTIHVRTTDVGIGEAGEGSWLNVVTHLCLPHNTEQDVSHIAGIQ